MPRPNSSALAKLSAVCGLIVVVAAGPLAGIPTTALALAQEQAGGDGARQVTVLAILATPGTKEMDTRLGSVRTQLRKAMPDHGFRLIEVESKRLKVGESITCDVGRDYTARTTLKDAVEETGKIRLRCEFSRGKVVEFSKEIRSPVNQLFFYERTLDDGKRVLIGVGVRPS
ncbi:hypothetical protein [Aquisphaera insulae]|uniref:hypothetical protein n=1 Tax=Aquisphaera insulae TaxID=2712864 RepID=UPI0013EBB42E|nr:hypothetical protein [Aquisphaera insulae]